MTVLLTHSLLLIRPAFTPTLTKTYNELKASGKKFELIFASRDHNSGQFEKYFATMSCHALAPVRSCSACIARTQLNAFLLRIVCASGRAPK